MSTIIIFYKGANQHSVSAGPGDRVVLNPGQNVVNEATWNKIVKHSEKEKKENKRASGVCRLIEDGMVRVFGEGEESGVDYEKLNQKDAIELINTEISVEKLEDLYVVESDDKNREKVLTAIDKQIDKLKKADDKS